MTGDINFDKHTYIHTYIQTDRQTDRQTVTVVGNKGSNYADPIIVARKRLLNTKRDLSITSHIYNFLKQNKFTLL